MRIWPVQGWNSGLLQEYIDAVDIRKREVGLYLVSVCSYTCLLLSLFGAKCVFDGAGNFCSTYQDSPIMRGDWE